jgi:hypothetical protein
MTPGQLTIDDLAPATEARQWATDNPETYLSMIALAEMDKAAGLRGSIGLYAEVVRRPDWRRRLGIRTPQRDGRPYLVNNTLRAGIVRIIIADRPDLACVFETRRSKCDPPGAQSTWGGAR